MPAKPNSDAPADNGRAASNDLAALEREHVEQLARAHAALAAAQDRSYWLERWGLDLNELMRKPSARRARAGLRAVREVKRGALAVKRYGDARLRELRESAADETAAEQASPPQRSDAGAGADQPSAR